MKVYIKILSVKPEYKAILARTQDFLNYNNLSMAVNNKKARITVVSIEKKFTQKQVDAMRRAINVLNQHNMSAELVMKMKVKKSGKGKRIAG
jgi:hypothetical protein